MQSMRRLSLHNHMKIEQRRKRYSTSRSPPPFSSILDNQLFKTKAGVAYIVSFIGCLAYNYITFAKNSV